MAAIKKINLEKCYETAVILDELMHKKESINVSSMNCTKFSNEELIYQVGFLEGCAFERMRKYR